jgi:alkylation response protein AidB-like acyl-CoA dehydrogenase
VDTRYSPEQVELRSATAAMVADLGPRTVVDLDDRDRQARLAAAGESAGWFDLRGPGEGDGPLASGVDVAIVARELGRVAADTPFLGPVVAADLARRAGADLDDGGTAVVLDPTLLDFARVPSSASGEGVAVDCAGITIALALGPDDDTTCRIVTVAIADASPATDLTRALGAVSAVADTRSTLIGEAVDGDAIAHSRALALAITVADLVGTMEGVLDSTSEYAKERHQYGVAIGSFQAVQHLLAEARVLVEGSISVSQYAAWAVDALSRGEALEAGAVAKAYCARAARIVCETAIQVHGGIGNTWECFVHVHLRRALLSSALFGDEGHHLRALAGRRLDYCRGL